MIERLLRVLAIGLSAIVALSFLLFALDEVRGATTQTRSQLGIFERPDPPPAGERARERRHGAVREAIDDAADVVLRPFAGVIRSGGRWVERGVPALLALGVYGFGLGFLARVTRTRASRLPLRAAHP